MLFDTSQVVTEDLQDDLFAQKGISVSVLRLDKIHPLVSGNKLFKLHYFLQDALLAMHKPVITFGGAYSNHLAATAFACKWLQLKSVGIVRGEQPAVLSSTLRQCMRDGMQLKFVSRQAYALKSTAKFLTAIETEFGACHIIPEGGYHHLGAKGAAHIMDLVPANVYSHICLPVGTATTLAGIMLAAAQGQKVIGTEILKGITDNKERIMELSAIKPDFCQLQLLKDYHFGGYAKKTPHLIKFINSCWLHYNLPLDFVYTAKMLYSVFDCIKKDNFEKGSKILCLHTGGLQGNKSLPLNTLLF